MRTKTLLLSAALGIATAVPALAQSTNVYSVNAVGYVNVVFPPGFSIRANPLNANPNTLGNIFDTNAVPLLTTIYRYDTSVTPAVFKIYTFDANDDTGEKQWGPNGVFNSIVLNPGEGFFVKNPSTTTSFTNTFVGEVPQTTASNQQVPAGFSIRSSVVPQAGRLDTVLGYPAAVGDVVYRYNVPGKAGYTISVWDVDDDNPGQFKWNVVPSPEVGEGFWISSKTVKQWDRNFNVNQ